MMSDFARTVDILARAGLRTTALDLSTVSYWIERGYSPERIAHKIYSVPADQVCRILDEVAAETGVRVRVQIPVA